MPLDLSVSVLSYRTPALLRSCLVALQAEIARSTLSVEVVVSDNASGDDSIDLVRREFPWVSLIEHPRNLGFGRAHNLALRPANGRYLLVLNSDAALQAGSLAEMVAFLDAHPRVAMAGPRLRYPDGHIQPSRRRFPTLLTFYLESTQLQRFWPRNRVLDHYYLADRPDTLTQAVDWLVGACLFVRASAASEVGLFDERYFMYSEELDWCRRFRAAGWDVVFHPFAEVQHFEGGSSRADLLTRDLRFQSGKLAYLEKWHGPRAASVFRVYLLAEYAFRSFEEALKLAAGSRPEERGARLRVFRAAIRHLARHRPSVPTSAPTTT